MIGRLFTEFALFLALAVSFSALVALTLSPAMAARLLRSHDRSNGPHPTPGLEQGMGWLESRYRYELCGFCCGAGWRLCHGQGAAGDRRLLRVPSNLAPVEDRGVIYMMVQGPGISIERMKRNMQRWEPGNAVLVGKG